MLHQYLAWQDYQVVFSRVSTRSYCKTENPLTCYVSGIRAGHRRRKVWICKWMQIILDKQLVLSVKGCPEMLHFNYFIVCNFTNVLYSKDPCIFVLTDKYKYKGMDILKR